MFVAVGYHVIPPSSLKRGNPICDFEVISVKNRELPWNSFRVDLHTQQLDLLPLRGATGNRTSPAVRWKLVFLCFLENKKISKIKVVASRNWKHGSFLCIFIKRDYKTTKTNHKMILSLWGGQNYFFCLYFLCLIWHLIENYGREFSTVRRWAFNSNSQYWWR